MNYDKLTPKQKAFADEYLIDFNGKRAAITAGYSKKTAETQASRMLRIVKVQKYISKKVKERSERINISAERVLEEFAKIAFGDMRGLYDKEGKLKQPHEWSDDQAAMVSGFDVSEIKVGDKVNTAMKKVKGNDKLRALEALGRNLKLFTDKQEVSGTISVNVNRKIVK